MDKDLEYKQNLVGDGFQKIPLDNNNARVNIIGEILQAQNYDAEDIYIMYEFVLPPWFKLDYEDLFEIEKEPDEATVDDWNKLSSVTQSSTLCLEKGDDGQKNLIANFCFPLDLQLQCSADRLSISRFPILYLQVNSIDSWNRTRVVGYGFLEIPNQPGFHQLTVKTWKPDQSLYARIYSYFLGGSIKLKDYKKIADTYFQTESNVATAINRFNIKTETTGSITVRLNIAFQSSSYKRIMRDKTRTQKRKEKKEKRKQEKMNLTGFSMINTGEMFTLRQANPRINSHY